MKSAAKYRGSAVTANTSTEASEHPVFTVSVKGSQWSVTVFPSNWPTRIRFDKEVPVPILSTMTSDGTYGYDFRRYNSNEVHGTQVADRWLSEFPAGKGSNA
jgi:hypothetical protein